MHRKASYLVLHEGLNAVQFQSYGPEARGGATRADVIISDRDIRFPKVIQPNVLICLTQEAYNKFSCIIRPGGLLLTDNHFVKLERKVGARINKEAFEIGLELANNLEKEVEPNSRQGPG